MKLLLDECVVHDLKRDLVGHEVSTVVEAGFGGLENGELLRAASGNFDVLITVDRNLPFQQNLGSLPIAVLILMTRGITYPDLKSLIPEVLASLSTIQPGELLRVGKSSKA
jgi:predicted nuclease of predicted toxin-antitoxin system